MLLALMVFGAGAIPCAVASSYKILLVGRTIQGLGGGGLVGLTTVLITDMVPLRDRGRFYALIGVVWAIGSTSGPIIGGALAQNGSWRWIFWYVLSFDFKLLLLTNCQVELANRVCRVRWHRSLPQAICKRTFRAHKIEKHRFPRLRSFHRIDNIIPRPADMGWNTISMAELAHTCPAHHRQLRAHCVRTLRNIHCLESADPRVHLPQRNDLDYLSGQSSPRVDSL